MQGHARTHARSCERAPAHSPAFPRLTSNAIPPQLQFGLLTDVTSFLLYSNELTGTVPTEIGRISKTTKLAISNNDITGLVPTQIGSLTSLVTGDDGCSSCGFLGYGQLSGLCCHDQMQSQVRFPNKAHR